MRSGAMPWRSPTCRKSPSRSAAGRRSSPPCCTRPSSATRSGSWSSRRCSGCCSWGRSRWAPSCCGAWTTTTWASCSRCRARPSRLTRDRLRARLQVPTPVPPGRAVGRLAVTHADASVTGRWSSWISTARRHELHPGPGLDPAWLSIRIWSIPATRMDGGAPRHLHRGLHEAGCVAAGPPCAADAPRPRRRTLHAVHRGTVDVGETWIMAADGSNPRLSTPERSCAGRRTGFGSPASRR